MKKYFILIAIILMSTLSAQAELIKEDVHYQSGDVSLKGYLVYDDSIEGKRPGVLVVHEWWGHNDYARTRAEKLAALGYTALALDMYGDGKLAEHPDNAKEFSGQVFKDMEGIGKERFLAAYDLLKKHATVDAGRIAAIGYCFGGGTVLHMARFGLDLNGVVSFHGSLGTQTPAQLGTVKAKVLVCNGADDVFTTAEQIAMFKKEMENAGVDYKFVNYEGAVHSFTNPVADEFGEKFGMALAYNKAADKKSWQDMQRFLKEIFE